MSNNRIVLKKELTLGDVSLVLSINNNDCGMLGFMLYRPELNHCEHVGMSCNQFRARSSTRAIDESELVYGVAQWLKNLLAARDFLAQNEAQGVDTRITREIPIGRQFLSFELGRENSKLYIGRTQGTKIYQMILIPGEITSLQLEHLQSESKKLLLLYAQQSGADLGINSTYKAKKQQPLDPPKRSFLRRFWARFRYHQVPG